MENIFVISYPRSGSNWLIRILTDLTGETWTGYTGRDTKYEDALFIKSHCFISYTGTTIYMYRHPKDTLLSWARHVWEMEVRNAKIKDKYDSEWIENLIRGYGYHHNYSILDGNLDSQRSEIKYFYAQTLTYKIADRWLEHMSFYHDKSRDDKIIRIRYETLCRRFTSTIANILDRLKLEKTKEISRLEDKKPRLEKIGQWEKDKLWTKKIDDLVNEIIGSKITKYGY